MTHLENSREDLQGADNSPSVLTPLPIIPMLQEKRHNTPLVTAAIMELTSPDEMRRFMREYTKLDAERGYGIDAARKKTVKIMLKAASQTDEEVLRQWYQVVTDKDIPLFEDNDF